MYARTGDGQHYITSYGAGYAPNYANPEFIAAHARAIEALGEAFGGDDFFHYVEIGSLGHWGEYHVNVPEGIVPLPYYDTRIEYIRPYLTAFPNAHFMTRYPLLETVKFGFGLYNDMTGNPAETEYWLAQMAGGVWEQTGLPEQADCHDSWMTQPVGGEFASTQSDSFYLHDNLSVTLEMLRESHQSFIGPKIIVNETEIDYSSASEAILTTIGYRFAASQATIDLAQEDLIRVGVTLVNLGNAPVYDPYTIRLAVYDDAECEVWSEDMTEAVLEKLLPGSELTLYADVPREGLDEDVTYTFAISIVDDRGEPAVPMALEEEYSEKVYVLASFVTGR